MIDWIHDPVDRFPNETDTFTTVAQTVKIPAYTHGSIYRMQWPAPQDRRGVEIKSIEFLGDGRCVPVLLGITGLRGVMLGSFALPRNDKLDTVVLADRSELTGTITNDKFVIDSILGRLELPAAKVLGLGVPADDDPYVEVVPADGQVIAGKLAGPITLQVENGSRQVFQPDKLNFVAVGFRISNDRPVEVLFSRPLVVLRSGERLAFSAADLNCTLRSTYGDIKLDPAQLASVAIDASDGALHRVAFRNGSVLSGLIAPDKLTFKLALGMPLEMSLSRISRMEFAPVVVPGAGTWQVSMKNEDQLFGKLLDEQIVLQTDNGKITVGRDELAGAEFTDEAFRQVEVRLRSGKTYSGKLMNSSLKFKIESGPEITVPAAMILHIDASPKPPAAGNSMRLPWPSSLISSRTPLRLDGNRRVQ